MFDLDSWQEIWATITKNKTRSFLTGFGVFWGLLMLILLMGVGSGFSNGIRSTFGGLNVNSCVFYANRTSEAYKGYRKGRTWSMNNNDLTLLRRNAVSVDLISPMINGPGGTDNVVRDNRGGSYSSRGVMPEFFPINQITALQGRSLNRVDVENRRKVCTIGNEVYETLFDRGESPLGQYIRVNGIYFQVVGVVGSDGETLSSNPPKTVYIPFTTMQQTFARGDQFTNLICTARDGYPASVVEDEVKSIVKAAHDIAPDDRTAIMSWNVEEEFKQIRAMFAGINFLVLIVGLSALLSGIIGITNIMLVTVRERTREIGVRRALGARPHNILVQIMSESVVLTGIAGLLGFIVAVGILIVANQILGAAPDDGEFRPFGSPLISFRLALGAMALLIVSGAAAGLMPALKALKIKAIDALRDE